MQKFSLKQEEKKPALSVLSFNLYQNVSLYNVLEQICSVCQDEGEQAEVNLNNEHSNLASSRVSTYQGRV